MGIDKLDLQSPDLVNENFEKLAKLFPNCVTEGTGGKAIDFDLLKQELSHAVVEGSKERYRLEWPGKREAIVTANLPTTNTLRPVREDSVDFDNTENLYIEGDNLEVLKLLQESYLNKVKMIYIDPPYNTGKDFVYKDNFTKSTEDELEESGQIDEYNQRLVANPKTEGRYHSDWLSMMYPRLKLARNLLTDDGVIFISIDDNEMANLKKVCDEIFGEGNFVGSFIKQSKVGGGSDSKHIAKEHEYVAVYSKSITLLKEMFEEHDEKYLKRYNKEDSKGKYFWDTFARPGLKNPINYDIKADDGTIINGDWIWSKKRFEKAYLDGEVRIFKKDNGEYTVHFKQYLNEKGKKPRSMSTNFGGTYEGKRELSSLFKNDKIFSYPKSIKHIMKLLTLLNIEKNNIILDFFSGSATTAHAVLEHNAKENNNLKYIMVQLPEITEKGSEAYKAGYENICEIGKERIRRAGKKIKEETGADIDYGFRVYRLDSSNMQDVYYKPQEYTQESLALFKDNIKPDRTADDLLAQVMLDWGLPLSLPIEQEKISGKQVFKVAGDSLYACFDENIDEDFAKAIAKEAPLRIVFKDSGFKGDTEKINVQQLLKQLSPETEMKVI